MINLMILLLPTAIFYILFRRKFSRDSTMNKTDRHCTALLFSMVTTLVLLFLLACPPMLMFVLFATGVILLVRFINKKFDVYNDRKEGRR